MSDFIAVSKETSGKSRYMIWNTVNQFIALVCILPLFVSWQPSAAPNASFGAGELSGFVFHPLSGSGLAAARISIDNPASEVYTDPDGRFSLGQLPAGEYRLRVEASELPDNLFAPCTIRPGVETLLKIAVTPEKTLLVVASESELPNGHITGVVFSALSGKPISGADVQVLGIDRNAVTDSLGRYDIANVAAGAYTVTASVQGCAVTVMNDVVVSPGESRAIDMIGGVKPGRNNKDDVAAGTIVGSIRDRITETPVPGVSVTLTELKRSTLAGKTGKFRFVNVPAGCYTLVFAATGYAERTVAGVAVLDSQVTTVTMRVGGAGRVEKDITISRWQPGTLVVKAVNTRDSTVPGDVLGRLVSGAMASIADNTGDYMVFSPVDPGVYDLIVTAQGVAAKKIRGLEIGEGDSLVLQVLMEPLAAAAPAIAVRRMRVSGPDGTALPGVVAAVGQNAAAQSDSSGMLGIKVSAVEKTWIALSREGYHTSVFLLDMSEGDTVPLNVVLHPGDAATLDFNHEGSTGEVQGVVLDDATAKPIAGVRVTPDGLSVAAVTATDGVFSMNGMSAGSHLLAAVHEGYGKSAIPPVMIAAGDTTRIVFRLKKESVADLMRQTVSAAAIRNNAAGLLKERQQSLSLSDAIGGVEMSRAGAGNAADAMKRVTGTTITDGKYVFVRGLGERYNITLLDGAPLPSPDPDKRTVPMDIFPTSLIENISTVKTFSADLPGDFTGGCINIVTKSVPEKQLLSVSSSGGINSQTTFRDNFLTYKGGRTDWLGIDDGTRAIPRRLQDTSVHVPSKSEALWTDRTRGKARLLDTLTRLFKPVMFPDSAVALPNQSYGLTYGNVFGLGPVALGLMTTFSYSNKYQMYNDGMRLKLGNPQDTLRIYNENKSVHEILWGTLNRVSGVWLPGHRLQLDYMYVRHSTDAAFYRPYRDHGSSGDWANIISSQLKYTEQGLSSFAVKTIDTIAGRPVLQVRYADISTQQNEPDNRTFTRSYTYDETDSTHLLWTINNTIYTSPTRYFRSLRERTQELSFTVDFPFSTPMGDSSTVKGGGSYSSVRRSFDERRFSYAQGFYYDQDPAVLLFSDSILGVKDTAPWTLGNYLVDEFEKKNNYDGRREQGSAFLMASLQLPFNFRAVAGLRQEHFYLYSASRDTTQIDQTTREPIWFGRLLEDDLLPAVNLICTPFPQIRVFGAWSATVLRPSMREITPYVSYDFENEWNLYGTRDLKSTRCTNFDLRCEWFRRPGDVISLGGYIKLIKDPIELVDNPMQNDLVTPENAPSAFARGIELEVRSRLDFIAPAMSDFTVGFNGALMEARTKLSDVEKGQYGDKKPPDDRAYFDQSPWVVNASLSWDNQSVGLASSLYFNMAGPRPGLVVATLGRLYKEGVPQLDWTMSWKCTPQVSIRAGVQNILNTSDRWYFHFEQDDVNVQILKMSRGVVTTAGLSFSL